MKNKTMELLVVLKSHSNSKEYAITIINLIFIGVLNSIFFIGLTTVLEKFKPSSYRTVLLVLTVIWLQNRLKFKVKEDLANQESKEKPISRLLSVITAISTVLALLIYYKIK